MPVHKIGFVLLYVAAILTLWSMFVYLRAAWPSLSGEEG
jgi:CDP-diacylglycerol--glycerol-3-phosphate 3-phosphatidyltransferase/cardiolipin synthase